MGWISKLLQRFRPLPQAGGFSIKGRKDKQEDAFYISEKKQAQQLIFVADGVGGHGHGDFASNLCVETFRKAFEQDAEIEDIPAFLKKTAMLVAASVYNKGKTEPEYKNCGTTLSGFFVSYNAYFTVNIGDSRVYAFENQELTRMTKDHSIVQSLIDEGKITEKEAFTHPKRNMMTSAIGQKLEMIRIDIKGPYPLKKGAMLLAFSDGVHDALTDNEIEILLKNAADSKHLAQLIVETAYEAGGKDNITACFYRQQ